MIGSVFIMKL